MQLIEDLEDFIAPTRSVVTSGTFDGVHLGHQKILQKVIQIAEDTRQKSVVLTFWPHPRFVLNGGKSDLKLLTTFEEKAALLESLGIDGLVKIPFTREFSELSSDQFIRGILMEKLNTQKLVIGYDHRFGKNREGGFDYLKEHGHLYGLEIEEISRQDIDRVGVSSTKIREALIAGEIAKANEFLGRAYTIAGVVKAGDQIGRSIGFPTANLDIPETYKLIPGDGAYAVRVAVDHQTYQGMLNIGQRPTVSGREHRIEVHVFDFNRDIYNQLIHVEFVELLRREHKFSSIEELKEQLSKDRLHAMDILNQ